jgi:hypothetical protein
VDSSRILKVNDTSRALQERLRNGGAGSTTGGTGDRNRTNIAGIEDAGNSSGNDSANGLDEKTNSNNVVSDSINKSKKRKLTSDTQQQQQQHSPPLLSSVPPSGTSVSVPPSSSAATSSVLNTKMPVTSTSFNNNNTPHSISTTAGNMEGQFRLDIPLLLRTKLVDDWDYIIRQKHVCKLYKTTCWCFALSLCMKWCLQNTNIVNSYFDTVGVFASET